ncbi:hypothetical protein CFOL_v3_27750 [Cephalotus follicularis]|uniref:Uncharacterized protein n=1 Tax=Cephalotus follicularis TaxID=3775 RepID=A0A1Q3CVM3_CEPFO|nr:hypothetical protein CFOL_v3_27750 [Cephalotus follicularis]
MCGGKAILCVLVGRCFWGLWKRKDKDGEGKRGELVVGADDDSSCVSMRSRCSTNGLTGGASSNSGQLREETSFNMGIGCCLLYLFAASRNELDKMVELKIQMEMLLQNFKEKLQRKDALQKMSVPNDIFAHIDASEGPDSSSYSYLPTLKIPETSTATVYGQSKCFPRELEESSEEMDQLEAELAAELERLQLHLDPGLNYPEQRMKVTDKDTASSRSHSASSGEVVDPEDSSTEVHCGVSPYELQRRLSELLEARQKEQIRELEAALECAKHKLLEKEIEISLLKGNAPS